MIESLKQLIHALREELQQYGEMLARLDEQQDSVMRRATDDLLRTVDAVQSQGVVLRRVRQQREKHQSDVARNAGLDESASFAQLVSRLPDDYRPLVEALVQENNELLVRVQQRARQNHLLLARSLELMQHLLGSLLPGNGTPVYNDRGSAFTPATPAHSIYEAVG